MCLPLNLNWALIWASKVSQQHLRISTKAWRRHWRRSLKSHTM